jgi:hypothetical protein
MIDLLNADPRQEKKTDNDKKVREREREREREERGYKSFRNFTL